MYPMAVVSIEAGRDALRARRRSDDGLPEGFDPDSQNHEDENIVPDQDDRARFARLVLPHLGDAYSLARWITGNRTDAEDVVQEASLRAFRAVGSFADGSSRAWVLTIVRNTAYTWMRKNRPVAVMVVEDLEAVEAAQADAGAPDEGTPEAALMAKADGACLGAGI